MKDFIAKLSPKERKIFYVAFFIVTAALVDRLFFGPALTRIDSLKQEIEQQKISLQKDLQYLSYADQVREDAELYQKYIVADLSDEDDINTKFFRTIEDLAAGANVNLIRSNPSETVKEEGYWKYYANLNISGELSNVVSFMHSLNSYKDLYKVDHFVLSPQRDNQNQVNASLTVANLIIKPDTF